MSFSPVYIVNRFLYRLFDFFHHWYVDGSKVFFHHFISFLERLDQVFAVRITLRCFFQPLYKDYTIIGRILGVIFRAGRIVIGASVYLLIAFVFVIIYVVWLLIPAVTILYVFGSR